MARKGSEAACTKHWRSIECAAIVDAVRRGRSEKNPSILNGNWQPPAVVKAN